MKKIITFALGISLILSNVAVAKELNANDFLKTITASVNWLKNAQEENGHFKYEYMPFMDRYSADDNIVRQAGAMYILGEVLIRDGNNKFDLKNNIEKAMEYFEKNTYQGNFNNYEFRCVLEIPDQCGTGATSLVLLGLIDLTEKYPDLKNKYQDIMTGYLNFILAMKKETKGFRKGYYLNKEQSDIESDFYNGEALLALSRYYKQTNDSTVKNTIDDAFEYFYDFYKKEWNNNFYLWGMAAIKELYSLDPQEKYFKFVKEYTNWRIADYKSKRDKINNKCAYLEGVVSAYSILEQNITEEEKTFYMEEINFWLNQSKGLQIKKGDKLKIQLNKKTSKKLKLIKPEKAIGGFLTKTTEPVQRIDYTQHCLSSFLQKYTDIDKQSL